MSYPYPAFDFTVPAPAPSVGSRRPATVTVAAIALFATAASFGLLIVTFGYQLGHYGAWADAAAAATHASPKAVAEAKSDARGGAIVIIVLVALLMLVLVGTGVMCLRRMRTGQITAYVLAVFTVLCCAGIVVLGATAGSDPASASTVDDAALDRAPDWTSALAALAGLAVPLAIAAAALLLSPSARRYFRRTPDAPSGYMYVPAPGYPGIDRPTRPLRRTRPYLPDASPSDAQTPPDASPPSEWSPPSGPIDRG